MSATLAPLSRKAVVSRQTRLGLGLAGAILGGWLALHVLDLFLLPWHFALLAAPLLVALQCWLSVGLFIVAHDAMHGSLARFRPSVNRAVGRLVLLVYAGIWYDDLVARHFAHHRAPGTEHDPDFAGDGRVGFWRWFGAFFGEYLTFGQVLRVSIAATLYVYLFGVPLPRLLLFWALPALLSAVQLFTFGTYLPHRREEETFRDDASGALQQLLLVAVAADLLSLRLPSRAPRQSIRAVVGLADQPRSADRAQLRAEQVIVPPLMIPVLLVVVTVALMELAAATIHRHVMHGFGWGWHRSHHEAHDDAPRRKRPLRRRVRGPVHRPHGRRPLVAAALLGFDRPDRLRRALLHAARRVGPSAMALSACPPTRLSQAALSGP